MAPKVNRRPAGAPRPPHVLRRLAVLVTDEEDRGGEALREDDVAIGALVHGEEAVYFNASCQFSGEVLETSRDASGRYLNLKLTGTNLESLLTWGTGTKHPARVHLCPAECKQEPVQRRKYRIIAGSIASSRPWTSWQGIHGGMC